MNASTVPAPARMPSATKDASNPFPRKRSSPPRARARSLSNAPETGSATRKTEAKTESEARRIDHLDDDESTRRCAVGLALVAKTIEEGSSDPFVGVTRDGCFDRIQAGEIRDGRMHSGWKRERRLEHVDGDARVV